MTPPVVSIENRSGRHPRVPALALPYSQHCSRFAPLIRGQNSSQQERSTSRRDHKATPSFQGMKQAGRPYTAALFA